MTRMSKQGKRRNQSPRKRRAQIFPKTGPKKDHLEAGYKEHFNAYTDGENSSVFIARIK